jgi:hypothetical protein
VSKEKFTLSLRVMWGLLATSLILCLTSTVAFAQPTGPGDSYYIGYFGNANLPGFPDTQVNIVNPGSTGGYSASDFKAPVGDLCANIYVFKSDQEPVECCSCFISPNGHIQLSTDIDLTNNPLQNPSVPAPVSGVIKVFSSDPFSVSGGCFETRTVNGVQQKLPVAALTYAPDGSLRTWNTHVRETVTGSSPLFTISEIPFRPATLSPDRGGVDVPPRSGRPMVVGNMSSR